MEAPDNNVRVLIVVFDYLKYIDHKMILAVTNTTAIIFTVS